MPKLIFHSSSELTLGVELELQLINPRTKELVSRAKDLIRNIAHSEYRLQIKPEVTQSMIELNTSIHTSPQSLTKELLALADFLFEEGSKLGICFCGGGTHPFQSWNKHKIFPVPRFKNLYWQHRYLSKRFTVFALHFHIGCKNGNDAIYLTHLLYRYAPHFIALSAASPYYQGIDTGFNSSRLNVVNAFPLSGTIPFVINWQEFSDYYFKMRHLKIIQSMKDFYWDVRPKPKFGTVEVRVCDTPLTVQHVATIVAYAQALARYILLEKPYPFTKDLYLVNNYNRFQACRFGFDGFLIDPYSLEKRTIQDDMLKTLALIKHHAEELHIEKYLRKIKSAVQHKQNDCLQLRNYFSKTKSFRKLIDRQCQLWVNQFK